MKNFFLEKIAHHFLKGQIRQKPLQSFDPSAMPGIKRILLLTTTAIGDTLFSTPAIRAVKETYPDKEVHVLVHVRNKMLLQENPFIDKLFLYHGKRKNIISLFRQLQSQTYGLVIILHSNDPEALPLAWATGAPIIIGPGTSRFAEFLSNRVFCYDDNRHAIERRLDFARIIGADTVNKKMDLFMPLATEEKADQILRVKWFGNIQPLIGLHPTGSGDYKWWPKNYFSTLLQRLSETYEARFIIFSTPSESVVARTIAGNLEKETLVIQGQYNLLESAALMKQCALMIANDSGPLHMALALGIPTLALIGADSPLRIGPYQASDSTYLYRKEEVCSEERCLNQKCRDNRCLKAITPEEVLQVIDKRFKKWLKGEDG
jgi:ADP-heptose:LPS heptosyltransferase